VCGANALNDSRQVRLSNTYVHTRSNNYALTRIVINIYYNVQQQLRGNSARRIVTAATSWRHRIISRILSGFQERHHALWSLHICKCEPACLAW